MIGLERHTVRLVEYQPEWAKRAEAACRAVRRTAGDLLVDVQHVGSTAVPGLPAKPVLDPAAALPSLEVVPELVERLTGIGYIYRGDAGDSGGHLFVRDSAPDVRTIHLHVVLLNGDQWRNYLRFRDALRRDDRLRGQYAELKRELKARFPADRKSYTEGKHDFIRGVLSGEPGGTPESEGAPTGAR